MDVDRHRFRFGEADESGDMVFWWTAIVVVPQAQMPRSVLRQLLRKHFGIEMKREFIFILPIEDEDDERLTLLN
jgi:hypothetical protein